jgi:hypothetical protein
MSLNILQSERTFARSDVPHEALESMLPTIVMQQYVKVLSSSEQAA